MSPPFLAKCQGELLQAGFASFLRDRTLSRLGLEEEIVYGQKSHFDNFGQCWDRGSAG